MQDIYQTFVCVVEQQTLSAAAEILHTTQPTVTRQIQHLEQTLSVLLFHRSGKRLLLTRAGERVYHYAREFIRTQTRMLDELGELTDPEQGVVRIGAGLTPAIYRLPHILADYRRAHPGVRFQVVTASSHVTVERLVQREIDLGIVTTPPDDMHDFELIPLWHDELCVVVATNHPLAGSACALAEFAEMPMVLMGSDSGLRHIVEAKLAPWRGRVQGVIEADSLEAMNRFVQAGLGASVMPKSAVADDVAAGRLATVRLLDTPLGARTITAILRRGAGLPAAAAAFVTVLRALAEEREWTS